MPSLTARADAFAARCVRELCLRVGAGRADGLAALAARAQCPSPSAREDLVLRPASGLAATVASDAVRGGLSVAGAVEVGA